MMMTTSEVVKESGNRCDPQLPLSAAVPCSGDQVIWLELLHYHPRAAGLGCTVPVCVRYMGKKFNFGLILPEHFNGDENVM